jgi:predicted lipoprotein with Yx(FWY)xxD motif
VKSLASTRRVGLGIALAALGVATILAAAQAATASRSGEAASATVVALRKTALGSILVDSRGRTLYLFEKDRNGVSMCNSACVTYWPALTSHGAPRAGTGVHQSLLRVGRAHHGVHQVTYAGHPLYTFVGDKQAGQTTGEGLSNFGANWYAVGAGGQKIVHSRSGSTGSGSSGGYSSGGGY